jgi:hypothetical protein
MNVEGACVRTMRKIEEALVFVMKGGRAPRGFPLKCGATTKYVCVLLQLRDVELDAKRRLRQLRTERDSEHAPRRHTHTNHAHLLIFNNRAVQCELAETHDSATVGREREHRRVQPACARGHVTMWVCAYDRTHANTITHQKWNSSSCLPLVDATLTLTSPLTTTSITN